MNLSEITRLIGKSERSGDVKNFLSSLNVKQPLNRPGRGEKDVYVEIEDPQVTILFSSEGEWLKNAQFMEGEMNFHTAFFESEIFEGDESLFPFKLSATMSRSQMRERLGQPSWSSPAMNNDRWIIHGLRVLIDFSDDEKSIESITFSVDSD